MGKLFELIADKALEKLDHYYKGCHVCNKNGLDLYKYHGKYQLENGEVDDELYSVCSECILTKKLSHKCDFEYIKIIGNYISTLNLTVPEQQQTRELLIEKFQRTPDIPRFMQHEDRPLCCKDITEFVGYPTTDEELYQTTETNIYWERAITPRPAHYDFRKNGRPENFSDVAIFRCSHCERKYFTFQFS